MPSFFDLFRRGNPAQTEQDKIVEGLNDKIKSTDKVEETTHRERIVETPILEDNRGVDYVDGRLSGTIQSISHIDESSTSMSPDNLARMVASDNFSSEQLINGLKANFSVMETFQENEEMSKDSVIGSAMETIADDACQRDNKTGNVVDIDSDDESLKRFLYDFLDSNININDRIWTWAYEIVKHGDLKLRRREYYAGSENSGIKQVYYEDVTNPYAVSRIEYMGNVLGYEDEDYLFDNYGESVGIGGFADNKKKNKATFEKADDFVHFISSKLSRREKIRLNVRDKKTNKIETVTCQRVTGTSILDNVRYIFRVINMLDNMLILSRVARSTQYNLVKVEVGNASPGKTQQILSDIRRRIEGSTKLKKGVGMQTSPSPIPINSNVYLPTRDGKGDIQIESVGDSVDVRSITDIDYFKDKEFAALKVPKQYLGFDETINGAIGNNSLVKMDIRYARSVQRVQGILINGITALCRNYLRYRGRNSEVGNFKIRMCPLVTADDAGKIEEFANNMQALDSTAGTLETYGTYIDKAKWFKYLLGMVGISPADIGSEEFMTILKEIKDGKYKEANHKKEESEEEDGGGRW